MWIMVKQMIQELTWFKQEAEKTINLHQQCDRILYSEREHEIPNYNENVKPNTAIRRKEYVAVAPWA